MSDVRTWRERATIKRRKAAVEGALRYAGGSEDLPQAQGLPAAGRPWRTIRAKLTPPIAAPP